MQGSLLEVILKALVDNAFQIWSQLVNLREGEVTRIADRHQSLYSSVSLVSLILLLSVDIKVTSKEPAPEISFKGMISMRSTPGNQDPSSLAVWAIISAQFFWV